MSNLRRVGPELAIRGLVNLISAFPQLASAILIDRYALSPASELEARGWPPEVGEAARKVNRFLDWTLLERVLTVASKGLLAESYAYILYHDAATGIVKPPLVYNYLSLLFDLGGEMYKFVWCVGENLARASVGLTGGSLDELRRVDALFVHVVHSPFEGDEAEETGFEYYTCTPSWAEGALGLLEKLATDTPGVGDPAPLLGRLRTRDPASYLLVRMAAYLPLNRAIPCLTALFGGSQKQSRVEGILEPVGTLAAFNYSARPRLRAAIETIESNNVEVEEHKWDSELGAFVGDKNVVAATWEGAATLVCGGFTGELRVVGDPPFEPWALESLGAIVEKKAGGYRVVGSGR